MKYYTFLVLPILLLAAAAVFAQEPPALEPPAQEQPESVEELKKRVAQQEETIKKLLKELNEAKKILEELKKTGEPEQPEKTEIPEPAPAPVEGKITDVRMDRKLVLINLGEADRLAEGDIFEVSRAGKKIGKIKVCVVLPDKMSNAEVIESDADFIPGDAVVRIARAPKQFPPPPIDKAFEKPTYDKPPEEPEAPRTDLQKLARRLDVLEGLYADLAKQVQRLADRLENNSAAAAEQEVRKSVPQPAEPDRIKRSEKLTATILDVSNKCVFLGVGTDHGIKIGDMFVIKRGERDIATVKVSKLDTDICKADIVTKNKDIRKIGDIAVLQ